MLRRHLDHAINDAVQHGNFEPYIAELLFGFTSTFMFLLLVIVLLMVIIGLITKQNILKKIYNEIEEYRYVLPLYYTKAERMKRKNIKNEDEDEDDDEPITVRPQLDFVVPAIKTDHITLHTPVSPVASLDSVSSIKRRTSPFNLQENN